MCSARANVCYGPKADMCDAKANVRYGPIADIRISVCGSLIIVVSRLWIKETMLLKKVALAVGLIAIPSLALAHNSNANSNARGYPGKGETKLTRSCYSLNASDCANLGRAETGGNKTCRGSRRIASKIARLCASESREASSCGGNLC